jgi:hypothetical protein
VPHHILQQLFSARIRCFCNGFTVLASKCLGSECPVSTHIWVPQIHALFCCNLTYLFQNLSMPQNISTNHLILPVIFCLAILFQISKAFAGITPYFFSHDSLLYTPDETFFAMLARVASPGLWDVFHVSWTGMEITPATGDVTAGDFPPPNKSKKNSK